MERVYRSIWRICSPLVKLWVRRKDSARGIPAEITRERFGLHQIPVAWQQNQLRNLYFTVWFHGASVGECLSVLPMIQLVLSNKFQNSIRQMNGTVTSCRVVLTTGTPAARNLLNKRLTSSQSVCVFAPLDCPACVNRFLDTWQPDAGIWIESELWPNMILQSRQRKIPIALINGRMSNRTFHTWNILPLRQFAKSLLSNFSLVLCQDKKNAARFQYLGAMNVQVLNNLKFASFKSMVVNMDEKIQLEGALRGRIAWVSASTHSGEETQLLNVHEILSAKLHSTTNKEKLLTIIIPRHTSRAKAILAECQAAFPHLTIDLRSKISLPSMSTDVFIVDTMGETELYFSCVKNVFIGGTLMPRGGHNPIEPLRAGCHVFHGPHMHNFDDIIEVVTFQPQIKKSVTQIHCTTELCEKIWESFISGSEQYDAYCVDSIGSLGIAALREHEDKVLEWIKISQSSLIK